MQLIRPKHINNSYLSSSNVTEADYSAYNAGTTYADGDKVIVVSPSATATMTIASPCVITWTAHGLIDDDIVIFTTTGALPTGITAGQHYYVRVLTSDTFNVSEKQLNFLEITTSGTQSGTHTATISSHKIYGPKGAGALFIKRFQKNKGFYIQPVGFGGEQEFGMRPGTENVPAIVGFGVAVLEAVKIRDKEAKRVGGLKKYFWEKLRGLANKVEINGNPVGGLPHIINVYFPKNKAEEVITALDLAGFAVSAGSACKARAVAPSYVVETLGYRRERALGSVRFSFGRMTTKNEVNELLRTLKELL